MNLNYKIIIKIIRYLYFYDLSQKVIKFYEIINV